MLLTCVLAGDARLTEKLRSPELLPLASRIHARLAIEAASTEKLRACVVHSLAAAGNAQLFTPALLDTLVAHAAGNHRTLMNLGAELLAAATERPLAQIDEKLFFDLYAMPASASRAAAAQHGAARASSTRRK